MRESRRKSSFSEKEGEFGFGFAELEVVVVVCPSAVTKPSLGTTAMGAHLPAPPSTPLLSAHTGLSPPPAPSPEIHPQPPPYPSISRAGLAPAPPGPWRLRLCCLSVLTRPHLASSHSHQHGRCHQTLLSKTPSPSNHQFLQSSRRQEAVGKFLINSIFFFISFQEAQH